MDIKHIFVLGAGTMGNGIAQVSASSGYRVTLMDVIPDQSHPGDRDDPEVR